MYIHMQYIHFLDIFDPKQFKNVYPRMRVIFYGIC